MIINNNIAALNTFNRYAVNQKRASGSLAKLSSGLRIVSAADDSAGLAISEKMRSQIRGLHQASRNAQDGISLIQTAEGGLSETQSILERLMELAVQATTDTYSADDRAVIQDEADRLTREITTIADSTSFNAKKLLSGSYDASGGSALKLQIGESDTQAVLFNIGNMGADALGLTAGGGTSGGGSGSVTKTDGTNITSSVSGSPGFAADGEAISLTYTQGTAGSTGHPGTAAEIGFSQIGTYNMRINLSASSDAQFSVRINGGAATVFTAIEIRDWNSGIGVVTGTDFYHLLQSKLSSNVSERMNSGTNWWFISSMATGSSQSIQVDVTGSSTFERTALGAMLGNLNPSFSSYGSDAVADVPAAPSTVTIADNSGHTQNVTVNDSDTSFSGTGYFSGLSVSLAGGRQLTDLDGGGASTITFAASGGGGGGGTVTGGIDVSTSEGAQAAIPVINTAISTVLGQRSNLGALQNRLEHTINNLGTANENLSAAESRIRDTDMAMEMMEYTKENILSQAASAMLAQANQLPQQVLQLLR
jgi:flagellin